MNSGGNFTGLFTQAKPQCPISGTLNTISNTFFYFILFSFVLYLTLHIWDEYTKYSEEIYLQKRKEKHSVAILESKIDHLTMLVEMLYDDETSEEKEEGEDKKDE